MIWCVYSTENTNRLKLSVNPLNTKHTVSYTGIFMLIYQCSLTMSGTLFKLSSGGVALKCVCVLTFYSYSRKHTKTFFFFLKGLLMLPSYQVFQWLFTENLFPILEYVKSDQFNKNTTLGHAQMWWNIKGSVCKFTEQCCLNIDIPWCLLGVQQVTKMGWSLRECLHGWLPWTFHFWISVCFWVFFSFCLNHSDMFVSLQFLCTASDSYSYVPTSLIKHLNPIEWISAILQSG